MKQQQSLLDNFYRERVPNQWNRSLDAQSSESLSGDPESERLLADMLSVEATIDIVVEGKAGNGEARYHLNIQAGRMHAGEKPLASPFLTLSHDLDSFAVLERESGDSVLGFLGALTGQKGDLQLTSARIQNLNGIDGSLLFGLTGENPMVLKAQFGRMAEGEEARCRVRLSRKTYSDLKSGAITPQDVFLNGRVEIEGDMQMAMQIALAAVSPT